MIGHAALTALQRSAKIGCGALGALQAMSHIASSATAAWWGWGKPEVANAAIPKLQPDYSRAKTPARFYPITGVGAKRF